MRVAVHAGQLLQRVPGGIGRYVRRLVAELPAVGVQPEPFAAGPAPDGVRPWHDLGRPRGPVRYELWQRLRWPPVRVPGDVVHATSLAVPPPAGRPLVVTVHDLVFERFPDYLTPHGARFHRRGLAVARSEAAALVVPSTYGRDDLVAHGFDPERVFVAPHGVDAPHEVAGPAPSGPPYVLFVGTIEPRKGLDTLVQAMAALRGAGHGDVELVVAGRPGWGEPPDLSAPWIRHPGEVDDRTLDVLYRHAVALALPSRYEGFGLPVVEAMARGCPVVTSTSSCLPEIAGEAGLLVPADDADALAGALGSLLSDDARRAELSRRGLGRAAGFTWRASAEAHAAAYRAAATAGRA